MDLSVRDACFDLCRRTGMTTMFGNPGSTELRMFRDWPTDFRYVLGLQESAAVGMAAGHAIGTGRAALVSLHSAGGVGHALGAVFNAHRDRVPMVITAGQQTRAMLPTRPFLSADEPAQFPRPYVRWSRQPERAEDVPAALAEAHLVAMTPPYGPVFLPIPEDDWDAPAEPVPPRELRTGFVGDPGGLQDLALALNAGRSPAIVAGPGVDEDGAWPEVVSLAERLRAPVWTAPMPSRACFPEDHPLFQGHLPPLRSRISALLDGHDVIVVIGAPVFTYHVHTEGPFLAEGTRLFQLDCDPVTAASAAVGTSVLTTVRAGTAALLGLVAESDRPAPPERVRPLPPPLTDPMDPAAVIAALRDVLPADAVVVEEAPTHKDAIHDHLPIGRPGGYVTTGGGALGWGLPVAVGRALGTPGGRVVCLIGDGSIMYSVQALWTAARHHVPLTAIVLNNRGYAALKALGRRLAIPDVPGTDLPSIDLVTVAAGLGCAGGRVTRAAELHGALADALRHDGPYLLDVSVSADDSTLY